MESVEETLVMRVPKILIATYPIASEMYALPKQMDQVVKKTVNALVNIATKKCVVNQPIF